MVSRTEDARELGWLRSFSAEDGLVESLFFVSEVSPIALGRIKLTGVMMA